jgi:hypothetical protein
MRPPNKTRLHLGAWFCLFAVLCLLAPFAEAAWSANSASCCTGDHCPISSHHHRNSTSAPAAHCDHERSAGLTACKMSCCDSPSQILLSSLAFTLPGKISLIKIAPSSFATPKLQPGSPVRSTEVLAPPPKQSSLA